MKKLIIEASLFERDKWLLDGKLLNVNILHLSTLGDLDAEICAFSTGKIRKDSKLSILAFETSGVQVHLVLK